MDLMWFFCMVKFFHLAPIHPLNQIKTLLSWPCFFATLTIVRCPNSCNCCCNCVTTLYILNVVCLTGLAVMNMKRNSHSFYEFIHFILFSAWKQLNIHRFFNLNQHFPCILLFLFWLLFLLISIFFLKVLCNLFIVGVFWFWIHQLARKKYLLYRILLPFLRFVPMPLK